MAAQWWYGSVFIKEEKRQLWFRMETSTPPCSCMSILENLCLPHQGRTYGDIIRLQDDCVCPYVAADVKKIIEAYGSVLVTWPTCSLDMDPIEHALDDFGRAIINRYNLLLTLRELA